MYTIHDNIRPFSERDLTHDYGEYYIDEYVFDRLGKGIKIEAGFYSRHLIRELIDKFKMPTNNVKWFIQSRKTLALDTFKIVLLTIFKLFPESQAKLLANSYIGELCRKYSRKDHGFTCNSLDTAQSIWTSALAENTDYKGNGIIYYGGTGGGKTFKLCEMATKATKPLILSFTNKAIENVKKVFREQYPETGLELMCYTFDRFFCDYYGRNRSNL